MTHPRPHGRRYQRRRQVILALLVLFALAACGGGQQPASSPTVMTPGTSSTLVPSPNGQWLVAEPAAHSVQITLVAGYDSTFAGFNFDGYGKGRLIFSVPQGWRVTVHCVNHGGTYHSCSLVRGALSGTIVFPGATSPNPGTGLAPGASSTFTFVAERTGAYRFVSLVPGQEEAGMWVVLQVTRGGEPAQFLA